jgi:predicted Mrr-cat superfamily restriction endonuclease
VLGKTTASVTTGDEAAVTATLSAYNALSAEAKALLRAEKTLLDSLKAKIDELKGSGQPGNPAQEAADAFKTNHAVALGKTMATVTTGDEVAVTAALSAYNALSAEAKALLSAEKTLLDKR